MQIRQTGKFADDPTILTDWATLEEAVIKMIESLQKADLWFQRNVLNLNPAKTRHMLFNSKTEETKLVKIRDQFIERVWEKGIEKSFKLVGIHVDEKLKWTEHIKLVAKIIYSANYVLTKALKELNVKKSNLQWIGLLPYRLWLTHLGLRNKR